METANEIASEHLEILTKDPFSVMTKIRNAGAIFLGEYSSEPLGDYEDAAGYVPPEPGKGAVFRRLCGDGPGGYPPVVCLQKTLAIIQINEYNSK